MTELVFRDDAYIRSCSARVIGVDERGITLDRTVFYPTGGGQPGDSGVLRLADGTTIAIVDAVKGDAADAVIHVPEPGAPLPEPGAAVTADLEVRDHGVQITCTARTADPGHPLGHSRARPGSPERDRQWKQIRIGMVGYDYRTARRDAADVEGSTMRRIVRLRAAAIHHIPGRCLIIARAIVPVAVSFERTPNAVDI